MKPCNILQELKMDSGKMPPHKSLVKLHSYFVTLSNTSFSEGEAQLVIQNILKYIDIVINDCATKSCREQIKFCRQWLDILQEVVTESISRVFVKTTTQKIFDILLEEDVNIWCLKKEILKTFLLCIQKCPREFRSKYVKDLPDFYLFKIIDSIGTYGDYDFQVTLIVLVFRMYGKNEILPKLTDLIPESQELSESFAKINSSTFDEDVRKFLNILNTNSGKVFSIVCKAVFMGSTKCGETIKNLNGLWVDFNLSEEAVSFYYTGTCSDDAAALWNLVLFFESDVAVVEVHRPPNSDEAIIYIKLKRPYISTYDDFDGVEKAGDIKLVISSTSSKAITLLTKILPGMFKRKFQHDYRKISRGNKKVYKPLDILLHRRSRSDSSKSKTELSGFSTNLNPIARTNSTQNTSRVLSISSTSTKCEVISISGSSIHSNGSHAGAEPKQITDENLNGQVQICPVENSVKISRSNKMSSIGRDEAALSKNCSLDVNLQHSQDRVQILSGRCTGSKLRRSQKSSKFVSTTAGITEPLKSEIQKSRTDMAKTFKEPGPSEYFEDAVDSVDEQNRPKTVKEVSRNKVSKSVGTKTVEKCFISKFFSDVLSHTNEPKSTENIECLGRAELIPQCTPHNGSISVARYAKVVGKLFEQNPDDVQEINSSSESADCFETPQSYLHEESNSNGENVEKHSSSKFAKDANEQHLSDNTDRFETAREVFLSSPDEISSLEVGQTRKAEKYSSSKVSMKTSLVENVDSITDGLNRHPQCTPLQGTIETETSNSENRAVLNKGSKTAIRKVLTPRPTPLFKDILEESGKCSNSESNPAASGLQTIDDDLLEDVLECVKNSSHVDENHFTFQSDQASKDSASKSSKIRGGYVQSGQSVEMEVYGIGKRKVFQELPQVAETSDDEKNVTILEKKNLKYKESMEAGKENFAQVNKELEEVNVLTITESERKIKGHITKVEELHHQKNLCPQSHKSLTEEMDLDSKIVEIDLGDYDFVSQAKKTKVAKLIKNQKAGSWNKGSVVLPNKKPSNEEFTSEFFPKIQETKDVKPSDSFKEGHIGKQQQDRWKDIFIIEEDQPVEELGPEIIGISKENQHQNRSENIVTIDKVASAMELKIDASKAKHNQNRPNDMVFVDREYSVRKSCHENLSQDRLANIVVVEEDNFGGESLQENTKNSGGNQKQNILDDVVSVEDGPKRARQENEDVVDESKRQVIVQLTRWEDMERLDQHFGLSKKKHTKKLDKSDWSTEEDGEGQINNIKEQPNTDLKKKLANERIITTDTECKEKQIFQEHSLKRTGKLKGVSHKGKRGIRKVGNEKLDEALNDEISPLKKNDKEGGLPGAEIKNHEGSIQERLSTNDLIEILGQEDLPASVETLNTQVVKQSCIILHSKLPKEMKNSSLRSTVASVNWSTKEGGEEEINTIKEQPDTDVKKKLGHELIITTESECKEKQIFQEHSLKRTGKLKRVSHKGKRGIRDVRNEKLDEVLHDEISPLKKNDNAGGLPEAEIKDHEKGRLSTNDMLKTGDSRSPEKIDLKTQISNDDIRVKSNNSIESMRFCEILFDQFKAEDGKSQRGLVEDQKNGTIKTNKFLDSHVQGNELGADAIDQMPEEVEVRKAVENREPVEIEGSKTMLNQTSTTLLSRGRRKLYDLNDLSYFEKQVIEDDNETDEKALKLVQGKAIPSAPIKGKVCKKKPKIVKEPNKLYQKRKKTRHVCYPDETLNLDRNNHLKTSFHEILESFRTTVNLNFSDKIKAAAPESFTKIHDKQSNQRKHEKHGIKYFPKRRNRILKDTQVRTTMKEELIDTSMKLNRKRHLIDEDPADIPLMSEETVIQIPEVRRSKKINIISNIQIVPGRNVQHYGDEAPFKKMKNVNGEFITNVQAFSENTNSKEMDHCIETGAPKYDQRTSERRFVLKHMYNTLKNLLGEPQDTQEYKDIVRGCRILKKYV